MTSEAMRSKSGLHIFCIHGLYLSRTRRAENAKKSQYETLWKLQLVSSCSVLACSVLAQVPGSVIRIAGYAERVLALKSDVALLSTIEHASPTAAQAGTTSGQFWLRCV